MNVLNCSVETGTFINETTARINFYGILDSIGSIFQKARRLEDGSVAETESFSYINVNGVKFPKDEARTFYNCLWWQFFRDNPSMVQTVRKYDGYTDGMPDGAANSPARVFNLLKKYGFNGLEKNCKTFFQRLKEARTNGASEAEPSENSFEGLDKKAKQIVKNSYGVISKDKILNSLKEQKSPDTLIKLVDARYDEKDEACSETYLLQHIRNLKTAYEKNNQ